MKRLRILNRALNSLQWDKLSKFGNTHVAKALLVAPILAIALTQAKSRDWLSDYVGLDYMIWLYWSLLFLASAQVIYVIYCPQEIKKYSHDVEGMALDLTQTYSQRKFDLLFYHQLVSNYAGYGGTVDLVAPTYDELDAWIDIALDKQAGLFDEEGKLVHVSDIEDTEHQSELLTVKKKAALQGITVKELHEGYQSYVQWMKVLAKTSGPVVFDLEWKAIYIAASFVLAQGSFSDIRDRQRILALLDERAVSQWKHPTIKRLHTNLNTSNISAQYWTLGLYITGAGYFIWTFVNGFIDVSWQTVAFLVGMVTY